MSPNFGEMAKSAVSPQFTAIAHLKVMTAWFLFGSGTIRSILLAAYLIFWP
jgi:hypothetical protein